MMLCGVDLIEVERVQRAIERRGPRFLRRIFTPAEIDYCQGKAHPWPHYAARFAAKEALFKALVPETLPALVWREIGVAKHRSGAPYLVFEGDTATRLQGWRFSLSLAHVRALAVAQVVALPPAAAGDVGPPW